MVLSQLPTPELMKCSGDLAQNWITDYATAMKLIDKSDKAQVATLKTVMGTECKQVLKRLELTSDELASTTSFLDKLEIYFAPERNTLYKRDIFHDTEQTTEQNG